MSALWIDGFDYLTATASAANKLKQYYDGTTGTATGSQVDASNPRNGTYAFELWGYNSIISSLRKTFAARNGYVVGFGLRIDQLRNAKTIYRFWDGGTVQCYLQINYPARTFSVINGDGSTVLCTSTATLPTDTHWAFMELDVVIDTSAGSVTLYQDGVSIATATGVNTAHSGSNQGTICELCNSDSINDAIWVDDYYVFDHAGSINNTVVGPTWKVEACMPTGAGTTTQWTPLSGNNYANVNEKPDDGDTTYNSDTNAGDIDTFAMADIGSPSRTCWCVQTQWLARNDNVGSRTLAKAVRSGGTNYAGTAKTLNSQTYQGFSEMDDVDPATSAQWTGAAINALEVGYKLVS